MPSPSKIILAFLFITAAAAAPVPQLAGEGAAADSILTQTDNGVGHGVENAEDNIAGNIDTLKATSPKTPGTRRQLDKISNGAQHISQSAGTGDQTSGTTNGLDNVDGTLTSGAANLGADTGNTEDATLEGAGKAVPKV